MANRFWVGPAGNYNSTNWATTTGGTTGQAAPTSSDDVKFDGAGATGNTNCTITATANALTVVFSSGYTATITINATFTWTVAGSFTDHANHTWTVTSTDTGALTISATATIASGGKTFPGNVTFSNTGTKTLSANWTITGTLTLTGNTTLNWTTAETLSANGLTVSTGQTSGTAKIILTGGTLSESNQVTSLPQNNIDLQGNVTITGNGGQFGWSAKTLKYVSGTITMPATNIQWASVSPTFDTAGLTWPAATITGTSTVTLNSTFTVSGTLSMAGGTTWAGTAGFSTATLTHVGVTTFTITLANTITYTVTTSLNISTSRVGSLMLVTSDHATNKAIIALKSGATCNALCSFTRIDASPGRPILSFNGTITTCTNVFAFTDVQVPPELPEMKQRGGRRKWPLNRTKTVIYQ